MGAAIHMNVEGTRVLVMRAVANLALAIRVAGGTSKFPPPVQE